MWRDSLPKDMRLESVSELQVTPIVQSGIYFIHLLYFGSVMLLYRRIMFDQAAWPDVLGLLAQDESLTQVSDHARRGIDAACQTARILTTLKRIGGVLPRCWLVM